jgi:Flp pilus assembly pilin Flp
MPLKLLHNDTGLETIEYALIAALVASIAMLIYASDFGASIKNTLAAASEPSTSEVSLEGRSGGNAGGVGSNPAGSGPTSGDPTSIASGGNPGKGKPGRGKSGRGNPHGDNPGKGNPGGGDNGGGNQR